MKQRRRKNRQQSYAEVELYQRMETPFGFIFWNPSKLLPALALAVVGAFLGLVVGSGLTSDFLTPLVSALTGLIAATTGGLTAFVFTLIESMNLDFQRR
jgi:hypothetical protein